LKCRRENKRLFGQEGQIIDKMSGRLSRAAAICIVLAMLAGCGNRGSSGAHGQSAQAVHQITVYYCKAGSDSLVAMHYTAAGKLAGTALAQYAVSQLLAGPSEPTNSLLVFPADTRAMATQHGATVDVDLTGSIAKHYAGGAGDEAGLFKSLTYTLTDLPGVTAVQISLNGQVEAALPGGHLELDEPLTRDTFAQ
jgi:spore germination protein GerM